MIFREIAIFDSDDTFVHSFTNSAFLFPCSIAFKMETMEAFVLGKFIKHVSLINFFVQTKDSPASLLCPPPIR
jgi:hypothetical protein